MSNTFQAKPSGYLNSAIIDLKSQPSPMVYKYLNLSGSISNVVATYGFDGSGCTPGAGASYFISWSSNSDIRSDYHALRVTINGGNVPVVYYPIDPITASGGEFQSGDKNDYAGNSIILVITWELIEIETGTTLQSGNVAGSPNSGIFSYNTNCAV